MAAAVAAEGKRLFIYSSGRTGSISTTLLDRLADRPDDVKLRVWEWELFSKYSAVLEMRYARRRGETLTAEQQSLFDKIQQHKDWLDSFSEVYVGCAMHNYSINVNFKTYFDILSTPGIAFKNVDGKAIGLFRNNHWHFVTTGGGLFLENPATDFVLPWLRLAFEMFGITNVKFFVVKGTGLPTFDLSKLQVQFK